MSFVEQERMLFDLLFDEELREKFCNDSNVAFENYDLNENEKADFSVVRADALLMDAKIRVNLVMSQICRSYPLTFSIVSSKKEGLKFLKSLVGIKTMRTPHIDRATEYGKQLSEELLKLSSLSEKETQLLTTVFQFEFGMAWTTSNLKLVVLKKGKYQFDDIDILDDWADRPARLAEFVSAGVIPISYKKIKKRLCLVDDNNLWRHLASNPTSASAINSILSNEDPRLMVSRAQIDHMSMCEPTVRHQTTELSEGFAPLFQHINGKNSINTILLQLKQAGASDNILDGVKRGFYQLLETGMLLAY
jgi:hypothetical protein